MGFKSVRIGRLAGIPIGVQPLWLLIVGLITWSLGAVYYPDQVAGIAPVSAYALGLLSALLLFASILLHELGHALVARRNGVEIEEIDLWLLGGVARMAGYPKTAGAELRFAIAGPAVTAVIAALFGAVAVALPGSAPAALRAVVEYQARGQRGDPRLQPRPRLPPRRRPRRPRPGLDAHRQRRAGDRDRRHGGARARLRDGRLRHRRHRARRRRRPLVRRRRLLRHRRRQRRRERRPHARRLQRARGGAADVVPGGDDPGLDQRRRRDRRVLHALPLLVLPGGRGPAPGRPGRPRQPQPDRRPSSGR